jgi:multidrug transporter EmrE-like cation transporter
MESDELYDDIQEAKTAFVITFLIAVYCFSIIMRSIAVHLEWKVIYSSIGFLIVTLAGVWLFIRLIKLQRAFKSALEDAE